MWQLSTPCSQIKIEYRIYDQGQQGLQQGLGHVCMLYITEISHMVRNAHQMKAETIS